MFSKRNIACITRCDCAWQNAPFGKLTIIKHVVHCPYLATFTKWCYQPFSAFFGPSWPKN